MSHFSKLSLLKQWKHNFDVIQSLFTLKISSVPSTSRKNLLPSFRDNWIKDREPKKLKNNAGFKQTTILSKMEQSQN